MRQKIPASKRNSKRLWTPRRLAEVAAEVDKLKQQIRLAKTTKSKPSAQILAR
jgi:hypothetical protein